MLVYHPAFDSYHCAYRALLILRATGSRALEIERARIWDFYFVFPAETKKISFPKELALLKRNVSQNSYEQLLDTQLIFARMKPFQIAAYRNLAAFGLIEQNDLIGNRLVRTTKSIPKTLTTRMEQLQEPEKYILELVASPLNELPLYGEKGLKFRTKLLDYKYDAT